MSTPLKNSYKKVIQRKCIVWISPDGALAAFGGLDAIDRVCDLRGRTAMVLDGHVQSHILDWASGFRPMGLNFNIGDDTIRIWDMRSLKSLYTIPAYLSNVFDVCFFYANDLVFKCVTPPPPNDIDMDGADKSNDTPPRDTAATLLEEWKYRSGLFFASAGYDGLVELWSADDWQLLQTHSNDEVLQHL
ncbi:U4/U6 small nuclear ribonucleoprotein PRP4-like protein [Termitomyces sp. J132]|nr:U4/U6 small nuclear ribonucleoprotein PRP4-like protein [Termitomyces sp. J132]